MDITVNRATSQQLTTVKEEPEQSCLGMIIEKIKQFWKIVCTLFSALCACRSDIRVVCLTEPQMKQYQAGIVEIERQADYPLGSDRFHIDHGSDYFAFFKRMGEVHYYVALKKMDDGSEKVVGVGCGILRTIAYRQNEQPRKAWYLCDLKVHKDYQGQQIPMLLFRSAAWKYFKCGRGYAISMNPNNEAEKNRVVRLFNRGSWLPLAAPVQLGIFSMDAAQMRQCASILSQHRVTAENSPGISFLSTHGKKDLVLKSTGKPLPLLHAQFEAPREHETTHSIPQEGFTHMFCAPLDDALVKELKEKYSVTPAATATILSHGMDSDWKFIRTSEI